MYTYNLNELKQAAIRMRDQLERGEQNIGANMLETAGDVIALQSNRIQHEGRNSAGEVMRTKSPRSLDAYSRAYALLRQKRGRQTDLVDFTLEGDLFRNYNILQATAKEVIVGFMDLGMAEIAGYLEAYFGGAWYLSSSERKLIGTLMTEKTLRDLR